MSSVFLYLYFHFKMKKSLFLLVFYFLVSCTNKEPKTTSFYYWKTVFQLSNAEKKVLAQNNVDKLYVRYFDVGLTNGTPMPLAPVFFKDKKIKETIVPVVFIKNEVFLSKELKTEDLVFKIIRLIDQINQVNHMKTNEIQIDCDWSLASRDRYVAFLKLLKVKYAKTISTTIRLHQIKYFRATKVPPVDYGVLMFYNMGKLEANGINSIYDKKIALQYLPALKKYPLPLKVALPIFSWMVHSRNNEIIHLISKTSREDFRNNPTFEIEKNTISVQKNTLFKGFFFKEGDKLHLEEISEHDLKEMKSLLSAYMNKEPDEIIYYDLDENNLKKYPNEFHF